MKKVKPLKAKAPFRNKESQFGYILVAPALIVIFVIAIWPVLRSFWISTYDIRLNDPTKTQIHSSYGIDLERYVGSITALDRLLKRESSNQQGEDKTRLQDIRDKITALRSQIEGEKQVADRYKEVDEYLLNMQPVPQNIKYADMSNASAKQIVGSLDTLQKSLQQMSETNNSRVLKDSAGLMNGIKNAMIEPNAVGLKYYIEFFTEARMWQAVWNTTVFTAISVFAELVFGLAIALLINRSFHGRGVVRAIVLIPWAIPTVISALLWKFMYDGQNGIFAKMFASLGLIPNMGTLLTTKAGSMFSIIFADVWKTTPFMALLIMAGLQVIPDTLYEAAKIDGASYRQQLFRITLPLLKSTMLVALLFRTLDAFRVFDLVYVLTGGGPANSTETISMYAYKTMFAQMNFGAGSALSVIVFLFVAVISIGFIKLIGGDLISTDHGK